jgi:hypoxanthine phosphoribosyltransferase
MSNKLYYTYDYIHNICRTKTTQIKSEFKPDIILAIGGGGSIPARIMRTDLKLPIYVVTFSTYDENDKPLDTPNVIQWMNFPKFKDKKILIVDEVDDTRKTLFFLVDKLINKEQIKKENLGVFVIHNKNKAKFLSKKNLNVSYYLSGEDVDDKWIVYPWEQ